MSIDKKKYAIYRGCSSKKSFYTTKDAIKAIHQIQSKSSNKMFYYKCPNCKKYHLTKQAR